MSFVKYIPPIGQEKRTCNALIPNLKIGEVCFLPEKWSVKLYQRLYSHKRKYGKEFEHSEIKNGVLIKRWK